MSVAAPTPNSIRQRCLFTSTDLPVKPALTAVDRDRQCLHLTATRDRADGTQPGSLKGMMLREQSFNFGFINAGVELAFFVQVAGRFGQAQGRTHRKH